MKRIILFTITLFFFQSFSFGQAQRKALIEEFTNASCGPCATQNPDFNALLGMNTDKVVPIKYQTEFPGFDPMHLQNPNEVNVREDYYDINGVPTAAIDGVVPGNDYGGGVGAWNITADNGYAGGPYGFNQAVYDYASSQMTPIELHLSHSLSADLTQITIDIKIKNVSADPFTMTTGKLHVALTEKLVSYAFAPGSNGEPDFHDVMRKMYPDENGTALSTIAAGDSVEFQMVEAVPSYVGDYREIGVVAFVQDDAGKAVWQAELSEPQPVVGDFPDAALEILTAAPTELCGATTTPSVRVSNPGAVEITSFDVAYTVAGGSPVVESWTGSLMPNADVTVDFPVLTLPAGTVSVNYGIDNINGGSVVELISTNNYVAPASYSSLSGVATMTELLEDNENYDVGYPENSVVDVPNNSFLVLRRADLTNTAGDPIGGYGNSQKSIWINFWQWQIPNLPPEGTMTYDKVDLSGSPTAFLTFDRAAGGYQGTVDRIQVLVSTNCGDDWTVVHDITGNDLGTGDTNSSSFFLPTASEWATDTIDLTTYAGDPGVHIQFKAISSWGNNVYLDNINLFGAALSANSPNLLAGKIKVFPNPTVNEANIEFELIEDTDVDIRVFDMTGKLVTVLHQNTHFSAGKHIRTWKGEKDAGVYLVKIRTNQGEISQRLTVIK